MTKEEHRQREIGRMECRIILEAAFKLEKRNFLKRRPEDCNQELYQEFLAYLEILEAIFKNALVEIDRKFGFSCSGEKIGVNDERSFAASLEMEELFKWEKQNYENQ